MKSLHRYLPVLGILLILGGAVVFVLNYETQTIDLTAEITSLVILEYEAPGWDPFPHYVRITVDTEDPVIVTSIVAGMNERTEIFHLHAGERTVTVYPNEILRIRVDNPGNTTGTIKTVLWCDSWIYAAVILTGIGVILLIGSVIVKGKYQSK
jgi:hypothetical protein